MKNLILLVLITVIGIDTGLAQNLTIETATAVTLGDECLSNPSISFTTRAGTSTVRAITVRNITATGMPAAIDFKIFLQGMSATANSEWTVFEGANSIDDILMAGGPEASVLLKCTSSANALIGHLEKPGMANDRKTYYIRYKPAVATGSNNVTIRVVNCASSQSCSGDVSSTHDNTTVDMQLNGSVQVEKGFGVGLVLDRSGSMSTIKSTGGPSRSTSLRNATQYFLGLMQVRAQTTTPVDIPDDKLVVVAFDNNVLKWSKTPSPLDLTPSAIPGLITDVGTTAEFNPAGSTAIGNALDVANTALAGTSLTNKIILFTDGEENVSTPHSVLPSMTPPGIGNTQSTHTVGIGSDIGSSFQVNLKNYAAAHSGTYTYISELPSSASPLPIDLEKAYLGIFNDLVSWQGVVDPLFEVVNDTTRIVTTASITASDGQAIFSVFEASLRGELYDLEIQSPKGEVLKDGALPSGITGTVVIGNTFRIFKADFSTAKDISSYSGEWKLILIPKGKRQLSIPIGFSANVLSSLKLSIGTVTGTGLPGEQLKIALDLKEGDAEIQKIVSMKIVVKDPNGNVFNITPAKDTTGTWYGTFDKTYDPGTYEVFSRVVFRNLNGELGTREKTTHVAFGKEQQGYNVQPDTCAICWNKAGLAVVALIILIIVLLAIRSAILKSK